MLDSADDWVDEEGDNNREEDDDARDAGVAGDVGDACDVSDGCVSDADDETAETAEAAETAEENIPSLEDWQLLNAAKKLSQQQRHGLLQIAAHQSSVPPGKLHAQYWAGGKPDPAAIKKLKALELDRYSIIFTRTQPLVAAAMREAAEAMVRNRQALSPADPGVDEQAFKQLVDEQFKQLVAQLVASAKSATGDLLQYACAAAAGEPASKVVGVSLRRDGDEGLAFADGFEDDFSDVQELIDRAEKTGPAMLALVLGSCVLCLSPIEVANALLSGDATGHGITMCDLAAATLENSQLPASQLAASGFKPAKVASRQNGSMGDSATCYNFVSVTIGTLYLYLNINGKGGKMKHKDANKCICLLVLLGFLHFGIISMTPQSEPSGIIVLVVVCSSSSSSSMSKRSSSLTTPVITTTQALH